MPLALDKAGANKGPSLGVSTCLALAVDETDAIHFQFWGDDCDSCPGIIRLTSGIFLYGGNRKALMLRAGKRGSIEKVGEFTMNYIDTPNISEIKWRELPVATSKRAKSPRVPASSLLFAE
ncbi:hypothetical protein MLD38_026806 [Melastoma candidum]|uniref:Uncharacterized protein n=1 Tax=Melastoma candidum TaxID=119954 RepID=A0ACB9P4M5_9MYRT|nr:hypothetical protein MLD38_026806 [Melastoma candidum]